MNLDKTIALQEHEDLCAQPDVSMVEYAELKDKMKIDKMVSDIVLSKNIDASSPANSKVYSFRLSFKDSAELTVLASRLNMKPSGLLKAIGEKGIREAVTSYITSMQIKDLGYCVSEFAEPAQEIETDLHIEAQENS